MKTKMFQLFLKKKKKKKKKTLKIKYFDLKKKIQFIFQFKNSSFCFVIY
jgi:hypothetical protein